MLVVQLLSNSNLQIVENGLFGCRQINNIMYNKRKIEGSTGTTKTYLISIKYEQTIHESVKVYA